jgi:hypothetical protein
MRFLKISESLGGSGGMSSKYAGLNLKYFASSVKSVGNFALQFFCPSPTLNVHTAYSSTWDSLGMSLVCIKNSTKIHA